jgi:Na+/phosphate symporter
MNITGSRNMAADGASGAAAVGFGLKSGLLAGLIAGVVSLIAVVLGFTVVPLAPGNEHKDAARRLAAGLLCSFTLGPVLAFKAIDSFPWLLAPWQTMLAGQHPQWVYLAAAAPFIAVTAVAGFWIVAAAMRWLTKRDGKDIAELIDDAKGKP